MIAGFDALMGFQLCMAIFCFVFSFRYRRGCHAGISYLMPLPLLYMLWNCVVVYYFADFFFLAVLWYLLGNFLSIGLVVLLRHTVRPFCHEQKEKMFYYPHMTCILIHLLAQSLVLGGVQCLVFYMPLLVHSWAFNEMLGFIPGIFNGILLGVLFVAFFLCGDQKSESSSIFFDRR